MTSNTKLPPLGEAMALPRTEETSVDSSKRLELIKAARNARPIPIGLQNSNENVQDKNTTKSKNQKTGGRAYLPLTTKKPKKKMPGEEDADQQFYRVFKLVYVDLPVPEDDLPCEQSSKDERGKQKTRINVYNDEIIFDSEITLWNYINA